jgi:steroid 5-alpha reductase family enzyme
MIAAERMTGSREWGYFTLISPVFITALLLLISGLPLLETSAHKKYKNDPTYINYLNETSILVVYNNTYILNYY